MRQTTTIGRRQLLCRSLVAFASHHRDLGGEFLARRYATCKGKKPDFHCDRHPDFDDGETSVTSAPLLPFTHARRRRTGQPNLWGFSHSLRSVKKIEPPRNFFFYDYSAHCQKHLTRHHASSVGQWCFIDRPVLPLLPACLFFFHSSKFTGTFFSEFLGVVDRQPVRHTETQWKLELPLYLGISPLLRCSNWSL